MAALQEDIQFCFVQNRDHGFSSSISGILPIVSFCQSATRLEDALSKLFRSQGRTCFKRARHYAPLSVRYTYCLRVSKNIARPAKRPRTSYDIRSISQRIFPLYEEKCLRDHLPCKSTREEMAIQTPEKVCREYSAIVFVSPWRTISKNYRIKENSPSCLIVE